MEKKEIEIEADKEQQKNSIDYFGEIKSITRYFSEIKSLIRHYPRGIDVRIPPNFIIRIEKKCDEEKIPCYRISNDTLSIAATYKDLLYREQER